MHVQRRTFTILKIKEDAGYTMHFKGNFKAKQKI